MNRLVALFALLLTFSAHATPSEGTFVLGDDNEVVVEKSGDSFLVYVHANNFAGKRISCSFEGKGKFDGKQITAKGYGKRGRHCVVGVMYLDQNTVSVLGVGAGVCAKYCTEKTDLFFIDQAKRLF